MRAKEIMTTEVITVRTDTPITEVARLMATHNISGVPVIDDKECVVGIVTEDNLLLRHDTKKTPRRLPLFGLLLSPDDDMIDIYEAARCNSNAQDIMTAKVVTFSEDAEVDRIAEAMVKKHINRVPIVQDSQLVGIVTRSDILRAIARVGMPEEIRGLASNPTSAP